MKNIQGKHPALKAQLLRVYRCDRDPSPRVREGSLRPTKNTRIDWIQLEMKAIWKEAFCWHFWTAFYGWISGGFQPCMAEKLDTKNTCCWNAGKRLLDGTPLTFQLSIWMKDSIYSKYPPSIKKQLISLAAQASKNTQIIYYKTILYCPKYTSLKFKQSNLCVNSRHILFLNQDISTVQLAWPRRLWCSQGLIPRPKPLVPGPEAQQNTLKNSHTFFSLRFHRITRFHQKEPRPALPGPSPQGPLAHPGTRGAGKNSLLYYRPAPSAPTPTKKSQEHNHHLLVVPRARIGWIGWIDGLSQVSRVGCGLKVS